MEEQQYEQGSERILNLLQSNIDKIISTKPRFSLNEEGLKEVLSDSSPSEIEFARYHAEETVKKLRRQNVSKHLATLAFMCNLVETSPEEEDRAISWFEEKVQNAPHMDLVSDEIVPVLTEFFERQLISILRQFPKPLHIHIIEGFMDAIFSVTDDQKGEPS